MLRRALARAAHRLTNRRRLRILENRGLHLHLGCGADRLNHFINIDTRQTSAADIAMDLSLPRFVNGSVAVAFSHAFFEHLYRNARVPHLRRIYESLEPTGTCCYIGIPYFPNIARFYLEGAPGIVGDRFDLFNVYRYTHRDPEQAGATGWWLEQLHKSLFDEDELSRILQEAGFRNSVQFCYAYPGEELTVSMGFFASRDIRGPERLREDCLRLFQTVDAHKKIRMETFRWLDVPAPTLEGVI